jgi:cobalt-zinc-cadmium efflux system outer membrane protein
MVATPYPSSAQVLALLLAAILCAPLPAAEPLSLAQLIDLAARNNPELVIARGRADAARGQLLQAGFYPNPVVTPGIEELGNKGGPAGIPGVNISQEIVTAGKLRLAQAAAAHGVEAADWQATTRWFEIVTRVRLAYYEMLTSQQEVSTSQEAVRIAQEGFDAISKLEQGGLKAKPDVLRARVELDQNRIRLGQAQQRAEAAGKLLASAIGLTALPSGRLADGLDAPVPVYVYKTALESILIGSSEVQAAQAEVRQAEQLLYRARAERVPNVRLTVRPGYSDPDKSALVLVEAGADLPLFNRNQGNITTAAANLARLAAEARLVELHLTERLTSAFQRYTSSRQSLEAYAKDILPNAREALRLVRLGYERGDAKYDYTAVLEAQRTLLQAQFAHVQARGELWHAVSEIEGLLQNDGGAAAGPTRQQDRVR